jgi:hypothetical protein
LREFVEQPVGRWVVLVRRALEVPRPGGSHELDG